MRKLSWWRRLVLRVLCLLKGHRVKLNGSLYGYDPMCVRCFTKAEDIKRWERK